MKSLMLATVLLLSSQAMAYYNDTDIRQNECPLANQILKKDYVGLASTPKTINFKRIGNNSFPAKFNAEERVTVEIKRQYNMKVCRLKQYNRTVHKKVYIDIDTARGMGNDTFRRLFDLRLTSLQRAELIAQKLTYEPNLTAAERLNTANALANYFIKWSNRNNMPKNWAEVVSLFEDALNASQVSESVFLDVTDLYANENKKNLGFYPMQNVHFSEGSGNGMLEMFFDLYTSSAERKHYIRTYLHGLKKNSVNKIAKYFISFANINGVPDTWNELIVALTNAKNQGQISRTEFNNITNTYEKKNRAELGFTLKAYKLRTTVVQDEYNAIVSETAYVYDHKVTKNISINVDNAPLLGGEEENFRVSYDGLNKPSVSLAEEFNKYQLNINESNENINCSLIGSRNKVSVNNTLSVEITRDGKKINMKVSDSNFNSKFEGTAYIVAVFYQAKALWFDKELGTKTYPLSSEQATTVINTEFKTSKSSKKAYVEYKLVRKGNQFYNDKPSFRTLKSNKK